MSNQDNLSRLRVDDDGWKRLPRAGLDMLIAMDYVVEGMLIVHLSRDVLVDRIAHFRSTVDRANRSHFRIGNRTIMGI